jgi:hypothetical protein
MTHQTFNHECFLAFPHLKEIAAKEFSYMGDQPFGTYMVFEGVLVPEIESAASRDPEYLARLMSFVEEVAQPGLGTCNDLVQIGLGERLPSMKNSDAIHSAAGPRTKEAIWRAERYLVHAERSQNWSPIISFIRRLTLPRKKRL